MASSSRNGMAECPAGKMSRATMYENAMSVAHGMAQPRASSGRPSV